ncbi:CoA transferase [Bradyrhizobium lupini]|uniref:CoA transferase n=1 Tax=Rhizobium lupini TaxID=136996 RepID=UPI003670C48E
MMLMVGNDGQFARACAALEAPELATNPKLLENNDRVTNGKEIMAIFAGPLSKTTVAHWLRKLEKAGVPCGPVNELSPGVRRSARRRARHAGERVKDKLVRADLDPQRADPLRDTDHLISRSAAARREYASRVDRRS